MLEANGIEFLRALHEEKIRTQNERAGYLTQKLALVTVILGFSIVNMGLRIADFVWLLYFVPMLAICYDLFFMSADLRIKRIGTFLGRHPASQAGEAEKQWEAFCISYQDGITYFANMFFSIFGTVAAALFILSQQSSAFMQPKVFFATWLVISLMAILVLWFRHHKIIDRMLFEPKIYEFDSRAAQMRSL